MSLIVELTIRLWKLQVLLSDFGVMAFSHATTQKLFNVIPQASENSCNWNGRGILRKQESLEMG